MHRNQAVRAAKVLIAILALAGLAAALMVSTSALAQTIAVPPDFSLRLVSASRGPPQSPPDVEWVEIKASGETTFSEMESRSGRLPTASIKLSPAAVAQIYQAVVAERFFDLQPDYVNTGVIDGDQAEMTVTANGRTKTVKTINIRVNAFDRITRVINSVLPEDRRIAYNALSDGAYQAVER
jgi:hypothetical protein